MSLVSARVLPAGYVNETNVDGTPRAIVITGEIIDTDWAWVGTYRIEGDELAALPATDPNAISQEADPRYQAIFGIVARFVKEKHAELTAARAAEPVVEVRPAEEVAQLPQITPEMLDAL